MNEKRWTYLALLSALMLAIYVSTGNHVTNNSRSGNPSAKAQKSLADQLKSGGLPPQQQAMKAPTNIDVGARPPVSSNNIPSNQVPPSNEIPAPSNNQPVANSNSIYALGNTKTRKYAYKSLKLEKNSTCLHFPRKLDLFG